VYRDGRATASSLLNVPFWWGWRGPENWRWGPLSREQRAKWEQHGRSFVALAAIQWQILMDAQDAARANIPRDCLLELTYEELCARPVEVIRRATDFIGLPFSQRFETRVRGFSLTNQNDKWETELTEEQKAILQDCLSGVLHHWGYGDSARHGNNVVKAEDIPATPVGAES
jgi:omega-hydroxy-beta-dihydromenaquinone-9 sulfotransferase